MNSFIFDMKVRCALGPYNLGERQFELRTLYDFRFLSAWNSRLHSDEIQRMPPCPFPREFLPRS